MTLTLSKSIDQLFCRMSDSQFVFVWRFLMIRLRLAFLARMPQTYVVSFSVFYIKGFMMSICPITGDINLDNLVKVVSAGFLHYEAIIIPFVVNKYLVRPWFLRVKLGKIAHMFPNDWATLNGRKTSNITLNTDKFVREKEIPSQQKNFLHASFPPHFLLPFAVNSFIWEKKKSYIFDPIWGNGNYLFFLVLLL